MVCHLLPSCCWQLLLFVLWAPCAWSDCWHACLGAESRRVAHAAQAKTDDMTREDFHVIKHVKITHFLMPSLIRLHFVRDEIIAA